MRNAQSFPATPLRDRTRWFRPALVVALVLAAAGVARAGPDPDPTRSGWLRLETSLSVTAEMLDTRWSSLVRTPSSPPDYSLASPGASVSWSPLSHTPNLIDISPARLAASEPQVYVRPQFALGISSDSLRGWLRSAGLNASTCTAPLMKMHSSFAGSNAHAKVSLSARCSLH